jgi:single-stranded-DNA-specific exonuclease
MDTTILPSQFNWHFLSGDNAKSQMLSKQLELPPLLAQILLNRNISTPEQATALFKASLSELPDPKLLPDYQQAQDAIFRARDEKHTVIIYGDYDADGLCGTALLVRLMKHLDIKVIPFIPDRLADGYSLGPKTLKLAQDNDAKLIITVDNGTSAVEELAQLAAAGIEVVVVDHHMPGDKIPECTALMNPWLLPRDEDGNYPYFVEFCGTAVAFILAWGVLRAHHQQDHLSDKLREFLMDLMCYAAIATISDVMPLRGPNRALVKRGLERLPQSRFPGLAALAKSSMRGQNLTATDIGFALSPRINAAGRLFQADVSLQALLADDVPTAERLVARLDELNEERKLLQATQVEMLMGEAQRQHQDGAGVIFVGNCDAHFGVLGIVAAKIAEQTGLPTFCWAECTPGVARGSARSPEGLSAEKLLKSASHLLGKHGGHAAAAGFEFDPVNAAAISEALNASANNVGGVSKANIKIDAEVSPGELPKRLVQQFDSLEPHGKGFREPVFMCSGLTLVTAPRIVGKNSNVMQFKFERDGQVVPGIAFYITESYKLLNAGDILDVVFTTNINHFRGQSTVQWMVKDLRSSSN